MAPRAEPSDGRGVPAPGQRAARDVPTAAQAHALAQQLLADEGTRLQHVRTAGFVAGRLASLFDDDEAALLVAAASLHDIGYSAQLVRTGFHPLDGGLHLRAAGYPERLAALIAHHSLACLMAPGHGIDDLSAHFPQEQSLLVDALVYADMHSAPDGRIIHGETRLADIAARRPTESEARRARGLRAAMARVGAAILAATSGQPHPEEPPPGDPHLEQPHPGDPVSGDADPESDLATWWIQEARRCVAVAVATGPEPADARP